MSHSEVIDLKGQIDSIVGECGDQTIKGSAVRILGEIGVRLCTEVLRLQGAVNTLANEHFQRECER